MGTLSSYLKTLKSQRDSEFFSKLSSISPYLNQLSQAYKAEEERKNILTRSIGDTSAVLRESGFSDQELSDFSNKASQLSDPTAIRNLANQMTQNKQRDNDGNISNLTAMLRNSGIGDEGISRFTQKSIGITDKSFLTSIANEEISAHEDNKYGTERGLFTDNMTAEERKKAVAISRDRDRVTAEARKQLTTAQYQQWEKAVSAGGDPQLALNDITKAEKPKQGRGEQPNNPDSPPKDLIKKRFHQTNDDGWGWVYRGRHKVRARLSGGKLYNANGDEISVYEIDDIDDRNKKNRERVITPKSNTPKPTERRGDIKNVLEKFNL